MNGIIKLILNRPAKQKTSKKAQSIVDFVKKSLTECGGNYENIKVRMDVINRFIECCKSEETEVFKPNNYDLFMFEEAYHDFFVGDKKVKNFEILENDHQAIYEKLGDEENRIWSKRGVAVITSKKTNQQAMYFGQRKEKAEFHRKDTGIFFSDTGITFHNEYSAHFSDIPLWGSGAHVEFEFDEQNHLVSVVCRYMEVPRLGFWSDAMKITFENGYFLEGDEKELSSPENPLEIE